MLPRRMRRYPSCRSPLSVSHASPDSRGMASARCVRTGSVGWFSDPRGHGRELDRARAPRAGAALSPVFALQLIAQHLISALAGLAGVFLTVTGGGALYADMGHFGETPIRSELGDDRHARAGLELLRVGRDAHRESTHRVKSVLPHGAAVGRFCRCVVIETAATRHCLASGDLRSVLRHHAGREPGTLPARCAVEHSSADKRGQHLRAHHELDHDAGDSRTSAGFRQLDRLAGAYGLAVSGAIAIVTPLHAEPDQSPEPARKIRWLRAGLSLLFVIDLAFLLANLTKLPDGGWLPLASGFKLFRPGTYMRR